MPRRPAGAAVGGWETGEPVSRGRYEMGGKADRLAVDLVGLEDFARNLDTVRTTMNGTRKLFDAYEAKVGSGKVADALHDFEHNWKDGRKEIDGQLEGLAKMAGTAVREIKKADQELADELAKSMKGEGK
jgi:hypothetical protein